MPLLLCKPYVASNSVYYRCPKISIICSEIQYYNCCYDNDIHCFFYYPHDKQVGLDLFLTNRLMAYLFRVLIYMEPAGKWIILRCGCRQDVINKTVMFILFCPRVSIIISICFYVLGPFRISCSWGRSKNTNELLNLRALKISALYKISIFQCMGKISWVEFQRYPLKFLTKYLTHTLKDTYFIHMWQFRSS